MKFLCLFFSLSLLTLNTSAQKSPEDLSERIFKAFKENQIENIMNSRLKEEEVPDFFVARGLDTTTANFKLYFSKYSKITAKFSEECKRILNDTTNNLSWKDAEFQRFSLRENEREENSNKNLITYTIQVFFSSNGEEFTLIFDSVEGTDKIWRIGNFIWLSSTKRIEIE